MNRGVHHVGVVRIKLAGGALQSSGLCAPGRGGNWLPFALRWEPGENAELDDPVLIDVELPPGASHGPVIDRRELARLGVGSAPQFRAYIAAHSVAWRPGVTRRRHPLNRGVHLWSSDPANYPGPDHRRPAASGVRGPGQEEPDAGRPGRRVGRPGWGRDPDPDGDYPDGSRGWLIVPAEAAAAIRMREPSREAIR